MGRVGVVGELIEADEVDEAAREGGAIVGEGCSLDLETSFFFTL